MKFFRKKTSRLTLSELQSTIKRQRAADVPLQDIIDSLGQIYDQALKQAEHTLKQLRLPSPNFDQVTALHQEQMNWANHIDNERTHLSAIMADRNSKGRQLERQGQISEAIDLYEANIKDRFPGIHPYDRLRIIYTRRSQNADAIRVCRAYLSLPDRPKGQDKARFQKHLDKLLLQER